MRVRREIEALLIGLVSLGAASAGCGGEKPDDGGAPPPAVSAGTDGSQGAAGAAAPSGMAGNPTATAGTSPSGTAGTGFNDSTPDGNTPEDLTPDDITPPPPDVVEMLDPDVDWEALTIIYPTMYSAHDGMHLFQVPAHVDGTTVELSGWQAIPSDAVTFDPDPDVEGGVLITVDRAVEQITIAASAGPIGGTAALFITSGTPEQWEAGKARYANGVEFEFMIDFSMLLDPNWMPPPPADDLACNNCHTTGAKYFEFQHTPTQAARFSDEDLKNILTMGRKPEGVGYRILPPMLGGMTAEELYADFHTWTATDDEITGLIIYLRSLTPTGQGDIRLPDGTYVPVGGMLPTMP